MPHDTEVEGLIIRLECPVPASRSNKQTNNKFVVQLLVIFAVFLAIIGIAVSMQREKIELALTSLVFSVTTTYNDDDLRTGKSCYYKRQRWHCQDCGDSNGGACRKLQRKRRCAPFKRSDWDRPARFTSEYNPASTSQMQTRTLSYQGWYKYHGQPLCTVSTCFNLSRCRNDALTVYVNTTGSHALLDFARDASVINITRVYNHQDACLVLVTGDLYSSASEMKEALHWQEDGRNHILWNLSQFPFLPKLTGDGPFSLFHVGHAAIASESLTLAQLRLGYDISLPLRRRWGRTTESVDIYRDRKYLLCFRGSIQNSQHPYYQHRWLAAEYWNDPDVIVDVQCKRIKFMGAKKEVVKPYELPSSSYDDMLWNSTFGFAPGGSGVSSFRFGEILSTGGIPVVVSGDFVPPLAPEIEWSGCVVSVSEARIIDLPNILRQYTSQQIRERQTICWRLLHVVIGDTKKGNAWFDDDRVYFTKAMEIWAARVSNAIDMAERVSSLNLL